MKKSTVWILGLLFIAAVLIGMVFFHNGEPTLSFSTNGGGCASQPLLDSNGNALTSFSGLRADKPFLSSVSDQQLSDAGFVVKDGAVYNTKCATGTVSS